MLPQTTASQSSITGHHRTQKITPVQSQHPTSAISWLASLSASSSSARYRLSILAPSLLLPPPLFANGSVPTHTCVQRNRVARRGPTSLRTATRSGCAYLARPVLSRKRSGPPRSLIARRALWGFMESQSARSRWPAARSAPPERTVPSEVCTWYSLSKLRRRGGGGTIYDIFVSHRKNMKVASWRCVFVSLFTTRSRSMNIPAGFRHPPSLTRTFDVTLELVIFVVCLFSSTLGISSASLCTACWPGYYSESLGASSYATCIECPSNHSQPIAGAASQWDCIPCSDDQVCTGTQNEVDFRYLSYICIRLLPVCTSGRTAFQDKRAASENERGDGRCTRGRGRYSLINPTQTSRHSSCVGRCNEMHARGQTYICAEHVGNKKTRNAVLPHRPAIVPAD